MHLHPIVAVIGAFTVASLVVGGPHVTTVTAPTTELVKTGVWLQNAAEGSWFEWQQQLYYVYTARDLQANKKQLKIVRFSDNEVVSSFGEGLGLQDAFVDDGKLWVVATDWSFRNDGGGNHIFKLSSSDLIHFSEPSLVQAMDPDTKVFNVSITKNTDTSEFVLAYEIDKPGYVPFSIRFLRSKDLQNWTKVDGTFGQDYYAACPELKYFEGSYYMWYLTVHYDTGKRVFMPYLTSSKDLTEWNQSLRYTIQPTETWEDINTSDLDVIEFNGDVYVMYLVSDQLTYFKITYALFHGSMREFLQTYYVPASLR